MCPARFTSVTKGVNSSAGRGDNRRRPIGPHYKNSDATELGFKPITLSSEGFSGTNTGTGFALQRTGNEDHEAGS
jgi:hypothetical protein